MLQCCGEFWVGILLVWTGLVYGCLVFDWFMLIMACGVGALVVCGWFGFFCCSLALLRLL